MSKKRQTNKPIGKALSTVVNTTERVNLGEELESKGAGGDPTADNLTKKKPAVQTGECSRPRGHQGQRLGGP